MNIKILGTGCKNCKKTEENARKAVEEMGIEATIEKVEDLAEIMEYGVMKMPAVVVKEEVKIMGKVPSVEEIKEHL